VISVLIPPLRERQEDLESIALAFLAFLGRQLGRHSLSFSKSAIQRILSYPWHGNIRELRNTIERAVILAQTDEIGEEYLPNSSLHAQQAEVSIGEEFTLDQLEAAHIRKILERAPSLDSAAKTLGIDPATLYRKRKRMQL
jgi:NtrC-family two-component system response regulator AlgB